MQNNKTITQCRICCSDALTEVIDLGEMCLTGVFPMTREEAVPRTPLRLVLCAGCGLVQGREEIPAELLYGDHYGYRSGLNQSMVAHLREKVAWLQEWRPLHRGEAVLDIGSNDGTLLNSYPESAQRFGFDPSCGKFAEYYEPGIHKAPEFFSAARFREVSGGARAAIITSIAMFYDLEQPLQFMREAASVLAPDGIWHTEQSYLPSMLQQTAYDTICHEHLEYYGLRQLEWLAERAGLKLVDARLNEINGGSFAATFVRTDNPRGQWIDGPVRQWLLRLEREATSADSFERFDARVKVSRSVLMRFLKAIRDKGETVLGYGASTKGNVILQYCGITPELLPAIMEVNESKFGCFTPGTGIPIISEAEGHARNPDYLLVLPWHFAGNIMERELAFRERGGKLIFPLPEMCVV